jgi:hypothetical protein
VEEYVPEAYRAIELRVGELNDLIQPVSQTTIIRTAKFLNAKRNPQGLLEFEFEGLSSPILADPNTVMYFAEEYVTIENYLRRVVERNDYLDLIVEPNRTPQVTYLWVHIAYMEARPAKLKFSEKDAGLFCMRTKSGEKAERRVARDLTNTYGHQYPSELREGPGVFQIVYTGKKKRKPDRVCSVCGLQFEVKKRNRDTRFRISHSQGRLFQQENSPDGWHAFVFPDMSIHYLSNRTIIKLIDEGHYVAGHDRYDAWADLDPSNIIEEPPPQCPGH